MDHTGLTWRKSSYSTGAGNAACVEVACVPPVNAAWRKSSYSNGGGDGACVEIARLAVATAVRDSKCPSAGALTFPAPGWAAFLGSLTQR